MGDELGIIACGIGGLLWHQAESGHRWPYGGIHPAPDALHKTNDHALAGHNTLSEWLGPVGGLGCSPNPMNITSLEYRQL